MPSQVVAVWEADSASSAPAAPQHDKQPLFDKQGPATSSTSARPASSAGALLLILVLAWMASERD